MVAAKTSEAKNHAKHPAVRAILSAAHDIRTTKVNRKPAFSVPWWDSHDMHTTPRGPQTPSQTCL
jgi:hypothetical protein